MRPGVPSSSRLNASREPTPLRFVSIKMDSLTQYQITETYLMSGLSFLSIYLFVLLKAIYSWWRGTRLLCFQVCFIAGWSMVEIAALVLFSLEHSQPGKLPEFLAGSIPTVLDIMSFWGVAIVQVR